MQLTLKAALAIAMVTLTAATVSQAEAQSMTVRLDNSPNPTGYPTATASNDTFSIYIQFAGDYLWYRFAILSVTNVTGTGDICLNGVDESQVVGVRMSIDGGDAFWLDQWSTYSHDCSGCHCPGTLRETFGIDNQMGYCFSQQSSDYSTANPDVCTIYGVDYTEQRVGTGQSYELMEWDYP